MDAALIRRRLVIHGVVQGVGFRYSLSRRARAAGVAGWVRNRADGTVEALLEGPPGTVDEVARWCDRGPRGAQVTRIDVADEQPEGFAGFEIR